MAISERREVTVLLTEEHLRKIVEDHLLNEDEIGDRVKVGSHRAKAVRQGIGTSGQVMARLG